MADQTLRLDTASHEEVAYKLWAHLRKATDPVDDQLQFFAKCRRATYGVGEFKTRATNE